MNRIKKSFDLIAQWSALVLVFSIGVVSLLATSSSNDPGEFGFADAGYDQDVESGHFTVLDASGSNTPLGADPADQLVTYFWEVVEEPPYPELFPFPTSYELENATSINPRFKPQLDGEYVVRLTVRWNNRTDFDSVSVFTHGGFVPPLANAGADRFLKHGSLLTLDASETLDWDWKNLQLDRLRYQWSLLHSPSALAASLSGAGAVNPALIVQYRAEDVEQIGEAPFPSRYQLSLHAIDEHDKVGRPDEVNIYVYPAEGFVYPVPVAGPDQTVLTGSAVTLDGTDSYDVDGRVLSYAWQFYSRPAGSNAVLTGANTAAPSFVADKEGIYVVHLEASNGERRSHDRFLVGNNGERIDRRNQDRSVIRAVSNSADAVAHAGVNRVVPANTLAVPLNGGLSYDPDADPVSYRWWLVNAPSASTASIINPVDSVADSAILSPDLPGAYVVGLLTSQGVAGVDQTIITLTDNRVPSADAGTNQAVSVGSSVQLNGSGSSDVDADALGYSWSLVSAPGANWPDEWPRLSDAMAVDPVFTPNRNGEYRLQLTVNDGQFSSPVDDVTISASGATLNTQPVASAGDDLTVVTGATVNLDASASVDPDLDALTYTWTLVTRPAGSLAVLSNPLAVTTSFVADVAGSYALQLVVNDGLLDSLPDSLLVTANDAGACINPLNLTTNLPFVPGVGEGASNIRIGETAVDSLSVVLADTILNSDVYQVRVPGGSTLPEAEFVILLPEVWEQISATHANPVDDSNSPAFVVRNQADNLYYRVDLDFTWTILHEVQIDALTGCRCGNSAAACP